MTLTLTILAGAAIVVLGLIGLWRDVQRGFLALVGTLLGVVLVQLWATTWATWVQERFDWTPSTALWLVSTLTFLFVAIFAGYGSGSLIRTPKPTTGLTPARAKALARPAGALLGVLNGALIASVLLTYARDWSSNETIPTAITDSFILTLLIDWFRWFVLGIALLIGAQSFGKWVILVARRLATRPAAPAQPQKTTQPQTQTQKPQQPAAQPKPQQPAQPMQSPQPAQAPQAAPSSVAQLTPEQRRIEADADAKQLEILQRTADKINQRLGGSSADKP